VLKEYESIDKKNVCSALNFEQVSHYRFSISWSRVLPGGTVDNVNEQGVMYYNQLIDTLLDAGIQPVVTLYHWDLPHALQMTGGWLDKATINRFKDYATFCYKTFGDRVNKYCINNISLDSRALKFLVSHYSFFGLSNSNIVTSSDKANAYIVVTVDLVICYIKHRTFS